MKEERDGNGEELLYLSGCCDEALLYDIEDMYSHLSLDYLLSVFIRSALGSYWCLEQCKEEDE